MQKIGPTEQCVKCASNFNAGKKCALGIKSLGNTGLGQQFSTRVLLLPLPPSQKGGTVLCIFCRTSFGNCCGKVHLLFLQSFWFHIHMLPLETRCPGQFHLLVCLCFQETLSVIGLGRAAMTAGSPAIDTS